MEQKKLLQIDEQIVKFRKLKTEAVTDKDFHSSSHYSAVIHGLEIARKIIIGDSPN